MPGQRPDEAGDVERAAVLVGSRGDTSAGGGVGDDPRTIRRSCEGWSDLVLVALSMAGLAFAMGELPVATSYAECVGIGAALTVAGAMAFRVRPCRQ